MHRTAARCTDEEDCTPHTPSIRHVTGAAHPLGAPYQPSNVTFGLFPPLPGRVPKSGRRQAHGARARAALSGWIEFSETSLGSGSWTGASGAVDQTAVAR